MILSGLELMGEVPFHDVIIHTTMLAPDGRRMSKSLGTGIDPTRPDRRARRRRDPLRAAEDVLDAGRALLARRDRGGCEAREQALERRAADPRATPAKCSPRRRARDVEERWILARLDAARARGRGATSPTSSFAHAATALYHLTFDDFCDWYAEAIKPRLYGERRGRAGDRARRARAAAQAAPSSDAARDARRSGRTCPARESRLIVSPWPEPDERFADDLRRARPACRRRRAIFRRSGVRIAARGRRAAHLRGRRAARAREGRRRRSGRDRPAREGDRPRRGHARERAVRRRRRPRSSRRSARSSRATVVSSMPSATRPATATDWVASPRPVARGVRPRPHARAPRGARRPAAGLPVDPRRGDERQVDRDPDDRRAAARRGAAGRRLHVARTSRGWHERLDRDRGERSSGPSRGFAVPRNSSAPRSSRSLTAAALAEFAEAGVDVAVVEAGLGGRLDATNVVDAPVVLLTNVALEHTEVLGETPEEIAKEKLAVAHAARVVVTSDNTIRAPVPPNAKLVLGGAREAAEAFLERPRRSSGRRPAPRPPRAARRRSLGRRAHAGGRRLAPRPPAGARPRPLRLDPRRQAGRRDARAPESRGQHADRDQVEQPALLARGRARGAARGRISRTCRRSRARARHSRAREPPAARSS